MPRYRVISIRSPPPVDSPQSRLRYHASQDGVLPNRMRMHETVWLINHAFRPLRFRFVLS